MSRPTYTVTLSRITLQHYPGTRDGSLLMGRGFDFYFRGRRPPQEIFSNKIVSLVFFAETREKWVLWTLELALLN